MPNVRFDFTSIVVHWFTESDLLGNSFVNEYLTHSNWKRILFITERQVLLVRVV